jgi:nucleoside-diphosphate-sugar epimerase
MKLLVTGGSGFIGTNLVADCLERNIDFINVDWNPPLNDAHRKYWKECDIMDLDGLRHVFASYQPTAVIHLAARTDTDIYDLNGDLSQYVQNTEGTKNVLTCIHESPSVLQVIITSSMFVCEAGYMPKHDLDFKPYTLYGVSKMLTEKYTREAELKCTWTIIRPQTIWGPWSMRYKQKMFKIMEKGLYFHPNKANVLRAYGYSGNVVWQIHQILNTSKSAVHKKVLYVGDEPLNLLNWANCISLALTSKPVRIVPTFFVRVISLAGDFFKLVGISFPITSTRFQSMVGNYITPIEKTYALLGSPPFAMEEGVRNFIAWHKQNKSEN